MWQWVLAGAWVGVAVGLWARGQLHRWGTWTMQEELHPLWMITLRPSLHAYPASWGLALACAACGDGVVWSRHAGAEGGWQHMSAYDGAGLPTPTCSDPWPVLAHRRPYSPVQA